MRYKAGSIFLSLGILLLWCRTGSAQDDPLPVITPETKLISITATDNVVNAPGELITITIDYDVSGLSNPSEIEVAYDFPAESTFEFVDATGEPVHQEKRLVWSQLSSPSGSFITRFRTEGDGASRLLNHVVRLSGLVNGEPINNPGAIDTAQTLLKAVETIVVPPPQLSVLRLVPETGRAGDVVTATVSFSDVKVEDISNYAIHISDKNGELELEDEIVHSSDGETVLRFTVPETREDGDYQLRLVLEDANGNFIAEDEAMLAVRNPSEPDFSMELSTETGSQALQSGQLKISLTNHGAWPGGGRGVWLLLQAPSEHVYVDLAKQDDRLLDHEDHQVSSGEYRWLLEQFDWRNPNAEILIDVELKAGFSAEKLISVSLIADEGQETLVHVVFPSSELVKLQDLVQSPAVASTVAATATNSEPAQTPIADPVEHVTEQPVPPGTKPEEERIPWFWRLVVVGLGGIGVAYLVFRRRRQSIPPSTAEGTSKKVYLTRADTGEQFMLTHLPYTIGRARENSLAIDDTFAEWQTISRNHAVISEHPSGFVIEDLGSRNGIRVEGRLTPKNLLRDGWRVDIGGVGFIVQVDENQEPETNHGEHA